ncbi:MAG: MG2 domain-containing protein, partial [Nitrospira sp.]|nr:MG2 domain-containing protein [Nitrospira sp.]
SASPSAEGDALATHMFNTGGAKSPKGLKGFFYGERDIWRPGDDIFVTFILMDRDKSLPPDYPLTLDLYDPRNNKVSTVSAPKPTGSFYAFKLTTAESALTGNWRAVVRAGGNSFEQVLRIESIVPNRLKMDLAIPEGGLRLDGESLKTSLQAQWLTGATAASLKAKVQVKLASTKTAFAAYDGYFFDDVSRTFSQEPLTIFEDNLDENGKAAIEAELEIGTPPPGMLNATFTERVFEKGGQASTQYKSASIYPFDTWIGMRPPAGNKSYYGSLDKEGDHVFDLVSVDSKGKPLAKHALELTVYKLEWRWWWDERDENEASYISNNIHALKETISLTTDAKGHAKWTFQGHKFDWGRHLIRVCDAEGKGKLQHCVSRDIYLGYGYNDGNNQAGNAAVTMILSGDKERYKVGDTAVIHLPTGADRRVFVSIENGSRILKSYWQDVRGSASTLSVPVTSEMAPNAYVFVSTYQAHQQRDNDLPMRVYGILPVLVDDLDTHITPMISVPAKVRPQSKLSVKVSEQNGAAMTYTLAVVDEGLLGVSDYKTPDPHNYFYKREALGVKTWDLFDWVVGAYSTDLSRVLAVGGSDAAKKDSGNSREQRFPPIVKFIGPFSLGARESAEHTIDLPPYMGAVRVMVVAGNDRAFGKAESTVTVTQPLVIHPTLPRVLGPGEEFNLPVDVFVSEAPFGNASISIEADDFFTVIKGEEKLSFAKPGEQMAFLRLKVKERTGLAKITVKGKLGSEHAQEAINIPVRSANLPSTVTEAKLLEPGAEWTATLVQHGMIGTNKTILNISSVPELKMEERLQYLIHYPYGCIEQTTSSVFPQLYLPGLVDMSSAQRRDIEANIKAAVERLKTFQTVSGGFSYWPYQGDVSPWGSNYAGHFLVEAKR